MGNVVQVRQRLPAGRQCQTSITLTLYTLYVIEQNELFASSVEASCIPENFSFSAYLLRLAAILKDSWALAIVMGCFSVHF